MIPEKSIEHLEQRVKHASVVNERVNSRKEFSEEMRNYCSGNLYLLEYLAYWINIDEKAIIKMKNDPVLRMCAKKAEKNLNIRKERCLIDVLKEKFQINN